MLQEALDSFHDPDCWPWLSTQPEMRAAWDRLTRPELLPGLELWLAHHREGRGMTESAEQVTIRAIEVSRQRATAGQSEGPR